MLLSKEKLEKLEMIEKMFCAQTFLLGRQNIPKIQTPLNLGMKNRTLGINELREKFQRFSNETLFEPHCKRQENQDEKLAMVL